MPHHPSARANGSILEHRYIAGKKLGRLLKDNEVVHHLDGIKTNNTSDNLIVFSSESDHARFHKIGIKKIQDDGTYICPIPEPQIRQCIYCGEYYIITKNNKRTKYCSKKCYRQMQKDIKEEKIQSGKIPSKEMLKELVAQYPFTKIGKMYGVSDSAVRKWCITYQIPYKYNDLHPKINTDSTPRFLLKNYSLEICNANTKYFFYDYEEAIDFIKDNYAKSNTSRNSIRNGITNAIRKKGKYFGFKWYIIEKKSIAS